ncbi:type III-B CRISPR-associated protein Cas10/Cmr2 [Paenibacillus sp. J5C_2022]|uniref:type III-B CRISPR-associated protein Cas10/Cmr2 n=1 Tax=Paenibacillus sp. J5C2022 TaxID=2977129 RepID=UPI0021D0D298|nr:type III-B CRISPR-associated protein Cas10/Cmr2 [Paenibacillus sp. J5C2022]MCU6711411.1 type III-B CRISPR-associated protein Cas10/Cmr2 [Paenibacillus sp. J5C2022]
MEQQIIIMTIGPVQSFIAQARKTRDLWYGSYLLSELSKAAARQLHKSGEVTLIFPSVDGVMSWDSMKVANKIVGIVHGGADARRLAIEARTAVASAWIDIANKVKSKLSPYINESMWDRQIKDFIECYAVWVPIASNYAAAVEQADQLMASRKTLRDFQQNEPGALYGDKKSKLDGGRESVVYPRRLKNLSRFGVYEKESLDAISLVKRLSNKTILNQFPSVCDIAFQSYRKRLERDDALNEKVSRYYSRVCGVNAHLELVSGNIEAYESALFYESRMEEFVTERLSNKQESSEQITKTVKEIADLLHSSQLTGLPNYYAFIMCDGDNMGETLRQLKDSKQHIDLSRGLSQFAQEAELIASGGKLVYSGGDDVMAYVSLAECMDVCKKLQRSFSEIIDKSLPEGISRPTLSIGVAIVHMLERLEVACELARQAERKAKSDGKNKLAFILQKRNGGTLSTVSMSFPAAAEEAKFAPDRFHSFPTEQIKHLQQCYREGYYSAKFPHELRELYLQYNRLIPDLTSSGDNFQSLMQFMQQDVMRLLMKKKPASFSRQKLEDMSTWLGLFFQNGFHNEQQNSLQLIQELAEKMIIAITIEKEGGCYEEIYSGPTA